MCLHVDIALPIIESSNSITTKSLKTIWYHSYSFNYSVTLSLKWKTTYILNSKWSASDSRFLRSCCLKRDTAADFLPEGSPMIDKYLVYILSLNGIVYAIQLSHIHSCCNLSIKFWTISWKWWTMEQMLWSFGILHFVKMSVLNWFKWVRYWCSLSPQKYTQSSILPNRNWKMWTTRKLPVLWC